MKSTPSGLNVYFVYLPWVIPTVIERKPFQGSNASYCKEFNMAFGLNQRATNFKLIFIMFKLKIGFVLAFVLIIRTGNAQNPIVRDIYTADPSAHVWSDGRLYVYPSHDIDPPRGCDLMDQYHVYSTDDMVHWTDHGEILRASQVSWGRAEGGFMWAPDCAFKNGKYYLYFPHPSGTDWGSSWKIGVATSTSPASGFTVQGYIPALESMIDPCVFVDDDGQPYFYYGGGDICKGGKLKDNMMEIEGEMKAMQGLTDFHEATWVHKRNGIYYLSYADNNPTGGNQMRYATSSNPLGPWTSRGVYIDPTGSSTDHGSIVEYKGQWYAFYHNSILSGNDWLRSVCVDSLYYNNDGTIQKVIQTRAHGTPYGQNALAVPGVIEVENYDKGGQGVAYSDNDTTNTGGQFRPNEGVDIEAGGNGGYNVGWTNAGEWMEYTVNVAETTTYTVKVVVASPDGKSSVRIKMDGKDITGSIRITATGGWQTYDTISKTGINLTSGIHILQLFEETGGFNMDKIIFTKETTVSSKPVVSRKPNFQIFPNPATSCVSIIYPQGISTPYRLTIYDLQGRMVQSVNRDANEESFDISRLKSGSYFVKIITNSISQTEKLLIK
jgi:arabinoxylan arabinofuranohydrolase